MIKRPPYFDRIRERAAKRWDQLEADPELAGPWHQLFKQVQSPRHILSELLQNADDAGATEASVRIEKHNFTFTHNGEDFVEEHFASLCRFGYSNKRALHTIGFRGIGFKSTFSLGDIVSLQTPTLCVAFTRKRFTEPEWIDAFAPGSNLTQICVPIADARREKEVEKNLQEWVNSPVSLLFFKHIRRLEIGDQELQWGSLGPGPVPDSEWIALNGNPNSAVLLARSAAEAFPPEAISEIQQERLLGVDQEADFPPCKVEIVLGSKGRLYVVLPTGVETTLPFAVNAPFIQDPARLKIKDPEISPTNRWLLYRVGELAGAVMLKWLGDKSASSVERSRAYSLLPNVDRKDGSLEGNCGNIVQDSFGNQIAEQPVLLTSDAELKPARQAVVYPRDLFEVWPATQVSTLLDGGGRPALSHHVSFADCEKLVSWRVVERITKDAVISILISSHLPQPQNWRGLMKLWAYIAPDVVGWRGGSIRSKLRIVPVQGKNVLYSASEIVRLGEKRLLQSDSDWEFLAKYLLVLNANWPRFIAEQRRKSQESNDLELDRESSVAQTVMTALGLEGTSDVGGVVDQVAAQFFSEKSILVSNCVQLTQIAAKLDAVIGDSFRFATQGRNLRRRTDGVLFDQNGNLEELLPKAWCADRLLHPDYSKNFASCSADEWRRWISSGRAGLLEFAPLRQMRTDVYGRTKIEKELRKRGCSSNPTFHYKTSTFAIEDWDFDRVFWLHWTELSTSVEGVWARVLERIIAQPVSFWASADSARAVHVATTGSTRSITHESLLPAWISKLRDLPCLPDTRGVYRKPMELLRRTPETESLIDVEYFVHGLLDRETTRPLLALLGVRDEPTGPGRLLDCLRALSHSSKPPVQEVEKWYWRLDQMVDTCSTSDLADIKKAFREERIVFTEGAGWVTASSVFLSADEEDVPGAAVIRAAVRDLTLWRKMGVAERPTADLAIEWLKELPSGKPLSQDDARRVRALLVRHPARIWVECGHWLNLAREWVPVASLDYALTMQTLVEYSHMHEWVKQKTADLQRLSAEITETTPFSNLPRLAGRIEDRFHRNPLFPGNPERRAWLNRLGSELCRVDLDDEGETARIRALAANLAETVWRTTPSLEIIPYIDGAPAGTPRRADVVWLDRTLYVDQFPKPKLARLVPDRLGKAFGRQDIAAAMNYCIDRLPEDITEYLEENFKLEQRDARSPSVAASPDEEKGREASAPVTDDGLSEGAPDDQLPPLVVTPEAESGPSEDPEELNGVEIPVTKDRPRAHPAKPSMMERFALAQGFQKDGADRFFHADGGWIGKATGDRFPWEKRSAKGDLIQHYLPKDHCLERDPLQLDADVWGLIDKFPNNYALILSNVQGEPSEVLGAQLRAMLEAGKLVLYPASYRLVIDHDRDNDESSGNPR